MDVVARTVWGFEALSRWSRSRPGLGPAEFIPIAEQSDLIIDLDRWVLNRACRALARWGNEPAWKLRDIREHLRSPLGRHLLVADVFHARRTHGVSSSRLVVELTETVLVGNTDALGSELTELRASRRKVGSR